MSARLYQSAAHRFLRNPNVDASIFKRAWSRKNPFENTISILEDPKTGKKIYLVGTTNSSTILATRTKKLIEQVKPETVYVHTSEKWYKRASTINVENQQQFNRLHSGFSDLIYFRAQEYPLHMRGLYFRFRIMTWMLYMNYYLNLPVDFNPWRPGVEMLWAIKAAEKSGANVKYLGSMFNKFTVASLAAENNISFLRPLMKLLRGHRFATWRTEEDDQWQVLRTVGGTAYAENLDNEGVNWFIKWFNRLHPEVKHILVDSEDFRFIEDFLNDKSKTIVAVVNQWHLPGVSTYWRRHTGTEQVGEFINPIGDMDINAIQEGNLVNEHLRRFYTKRTKSEPAAWSSYLTHYHKSVMEPERERHVFFDSHADHHLVHGLFNDENKHVAYFNAAHHDEAHGHDHPGSVEHKSQILADMVGNTEAASAKDSKKSSKKRKN
jgi:hypothetical protein